MGILYNVFNPARSQSRSWNLFKTMFQTSLFWVLFLYILPQGILMIESWLNFPTFYSKPILGWMLFAAFSLLGLSSGATMSLIGKGTPLPMDCPNELVVKGPYKIIRNPMALAGIGQGVSVGILYGSWAIVFYALCGAVLWHVAVRPSEEEDLTKRFGNSYVQYKKNTWCWIPKVFKE